MKKTLIALAALAGAGGAMAQAQFNMPVAPGQVQLFGVADVNWQRGTSGGTGNASKTAISSGGLSTSRIGLRGTEDLGGGMSASFWFESTIGADSGVGSATSTNNQSTGSGTAATALGSQGLTFNRESWVSVQGGWGGLRLGRTIKADFITQALNDPFGIIGIGANQVLSGVTLLAAPAGSAAAATAIPFGSSTAPLYGSQIRVSNQVSYLTPNIGGFSGSVQYFLGENNQTGAATEDDGTGYAWRASYAAGPLSLAIGTSKTKYSALGDAESMTLGGSFNFGVATVMGFYARDELGGTAAATSAKGDGFLIGANVPVGAGLIRTSFSTYEVDLGAGREPKAKKFALGYVHNLSKRTAAYTTVARLKNSGGAAGTLGGATTGGANQSSTGYEVGLRHSF